MHNTLLPPSSKYWDAAYRKFSRRLIKPATLVRQPTTKGRGLLPPFPLLPYDLAAPACVAPRIASPPLCFKSARGRQSRLKPSARRIMWKSAEDLLLSAAVRRFGTASWSKISRCVPGRVGKQCRERWVNHVDPTVSKGSWSRKEIHTLIELYGKVGSKWSNIAKHLPGRPPNDVKNYWFKRQAGKTRKTRRMKNNKKLSCIHVDFRAAGIAGATPTHDGVSGKEHSAVVRSEENESRPRLSTKSLKLPCASNPTT